jgi:succinate dehydrogenase/fumarate reductase-like Fe-S protein
VVWLQERSLGEYTNCINCGCCAGKVNSLTAHDYVVSYYRKRSYVLPAGLGLSDSFLDLAVVDTRTGDREKEISRNNLAILGDLSAPA